MSKHEDTKSDPKPAKFERFADKPPTFDPSAPAKPKLADGFLTVREIAQDEKLWDEFFEQNPPKFQSAFSFISVEARIEAINRVLQINDADGATAVELKGYKRPTEAKPAKK